VGRTGPSPGCIIGTFSPKCLGTKTSALFTFMYPSPERGESPVRQSQFLWVSFVLLSILHSPSFSQLSCESECGVANKTKQSISCSPGQKAVCGCKDCGWFCEDNDNRCEGKPTPPPPSPAPAAAAPTPNPRVCCHTRGIGCGTGTYDWVDTQTCSTIVNGDPSICPDSYCGH
jgi:hypothetical protein